MATGLPWPLLVYMGLATTAFTLWVEINALKASAIHIMACPLLPLDFKMQGYGHGHDNKRLMTACTLVPENLNSA